MCHKHTYIYKKTGVPPPNFTTRLWNSIREKNSDLLYLFWLISNMLGKFIIMIEELLGKVKSDFQEK